MANKNNTKQATVTDCHGEAHSNAFIDNCMVCLNHRWGKIFRCPDCMNSVKLGKRAVKCACGTKVTKPVEE